MINRALQRRLAIARDQQTPARPPRHKWRNFAICIIAHILLGHDVPITVNVQSPLIVVSL
jgi:hypothetical protein